jgi:hypothetical protein
MQPENKFSNIQNLQLTDSAAENQLKEITEKYPWFQAGWLFYLKKLKSENTALFGEVHKKVSVIIPNQKVITNFLNNNETESYSGNMSYFSLNTDGRELINEGNSLVDRFLKTGNTSIKAKALNGEILVNKENPEEKSAAESDDLITETLASIFLQQKKYEKAQKAYEKLSLKYPEKSIYFASQIKEIEKLKNNNI